MRSPNLSTLALAAVAVAIFALGCDRAVEPYVPGEQPSQPDLSRIFPEGAERATQDEPMPGQGGARPGMPGATGGRGAAPVAGGSAEPLRGTVTLAPELERKAPAGAILFIIARGAQGGGPPLAVKRVESPRFPLDFEIGPGDRMIEAMPFVGPLQLSARLDADGNAMTRAPGDLQGEAPGSYQPGATGIALTIDQSL